MSGPHRRCRHLCDLSAAPSRLAHLSQRSERRSPSLGSSSGLFYASVWLHGQPLLLQIHLTQWSLLGLPTLALVLGLRLDVRQTLVLRSPGLKGLAAGCFIGAGTWYAASLLAQALAGEVLPMPGPQMQALVDELMRLGRDPTTAPWLFLGAALAPALFEEFLLRGVLLPSLRRVLSDRSALVISSSAFALMHMNIHQLPTTLVVGVLLGFLVIRTRSIWPAVCLHALHNGLALAVQLHLSDALVDDARWGLVLAGPLVGFVMLWRYGPRNDRRRCEAALL